MTWSTDVSANTQLAYVTTSALVTLIPLPSALTNSHGVILTGLTSGTTYYFKAQSIGANGATGYSTIYSFTTGGTAPVTPTPFITNVQTSVTNNSTTISWTTDELAPTQVNDGLTNNYTLSSMPDSTLVTSHSVTLTDQKAWQTWRRTIPRSRPGPLI